MSPDEFILEVLFKTGNTIVLRIKVIVNLTTFSRRLVYHQIELEISCLNPLPPLMGERVGFQLNGAYFFLGMHLLHTHEW